jgi:hypothetical protein
MPRSTSKIDSQPHEDGEHAHKVNRGRPLPSIADSSHSVPMPGPWPASMITDRPPTGAFAGSNNVNIDRSVFTDIAGDQMININVGSVQQDNGISPSNKYCSHLIIFQNRHIAYQQAALCKGCWIFI